MERANTLMRSSDNGSVGHFMPSSRPCDRLAKPISTEHHVGTALYNASTIVKRGRRARTSKCCTFIQGVSYNHSCPCTQATSYNMGSISEHKSVFADLENVPYDEAYRVQQAFDQDASPDKISLGAGVYRDEHAQAWTLPSVKMVRAKIWRSRVRLEGSPCLTASRPCPRSPTCTTI